MVVRRLGAAAQRRSSSANWNVNSPIGTDQAPVDFTFTTAGVYTFLCDVHGSGMSGSVTVEDTGRRPARERPRVLQDGRLPPRLQHRRGSRRSSCSARRTTSTSTATEDSAAFTDANLAQYDAVVWLSTTGDVLNDPQQAAFENYIQAGGGYVGIHSAADTEYTWSWYGQMLGGYFKNHPPGTPTASVDIVDANEPSTRAFPPAGHARTSGTTTSRRTTRSSTAAGPTTARAERRPRARHRRRDDLRRAGRQRRGRRPPDRLVLRVRRRPDVVHGDGPHQASFTEADFLEHILGGLQTVTGAEASDCGAPREATPSPTTSRRSRSTTTRRTRWSSTSRPTGACSTSSATVA